MCYFFFNRDGTQQKHYVNLNVRHLIVYFIVLYCLTSYRKVSHSLDLAAFQVVSAFFEKHCPLLDTVYKDKNLEVAK